MATSITKLAFSPEDTKREPETGFGGGKGGNAVPRFSQGKRRCRSPAAKGAQEGQGGKTRMGIMVGGKPIAQGLVGALRGVLAGRPCP